VGEFDRAELEALYARLERRVFNVVYRWLWDRQEAQEVTQEAFLKLWKMRHRIEPATVEPLTFRMAINLASNRRRARALRRWIGWESVPEIAAKEDSSAEDQARVHAAIEALPEKLKAVVVMTELSEMSYQQVSEALGIPPGTVASRRSAAMVLLRKSLGAEDVA
jgi:RNA polymerase sigma-70 factor (ECF subfamily)